jgi:hypothetical protein
MNFKKSSNLARGLFVLLLSVGFVLLFVWIIGNPSLRGKSAGSQEGASLTPSALAAELVTPSTLVAATQIPPPTSGISVTHRKAGAGVILEVGLSKFPSYIVVNNNWFTDIGEKRIRVFAGAQRGDGAKELPKPWHGFVAVVVTSLDGLNNYPDEGGLYWTPSVEGPLRIVDADGMQLTLLAENGKAFFFDVSSRQYVFPGPRLPVQRAGGDGVITESGDFPQLGSLENKYKFFNYWSKVQGNETMNVLAGEQLPENPNRITRGVLALVKTSKDQQKVISIETFEIPFGVRILDATADQITLYANDQYRFVFDVDLNKFTYWPEMLTELLAPQTPGPSPNIPKKTSAPPPLLDTSAPLPGMPYPYPPGYP